MKIKKLEKKYFSFLPKEKSKEKNSKVIELSVGDWIYSEYFKTTNKVKSLNIDNDSVWFHFKWADNTGGYGTYTHFSNKDGVGRHRKATKKEIKKRLKKEIKLLSIN
jgi:hypothetical protein